MSGASRQHDVRPGAQAKWVKTPHCPATVSGERHLLDTSLGSKGPGKTRGVAPTRESGHLVTRGRLFSARETPRGASMSFLRFGREGAALRPLHLFLALLFSVVGAAQARAANVTGQVVDATGRALQRAYVRTLSKTGAQADGVFTDEAGRFTLRGPDSELGLVTDSEPCRVEASLSGFQTIAIPCSAVVRIELPIAPI